MRKKGTAWLAMLLAGIMVFSMVGCGDSKGSNGKSSERGEMVFDKYLEDEEVVDLKGYKFKIIDFNTEVWQPEEVDDERKQLCVDIIEDVENTFNCTIEVEYVSADAIFDKVQPAVMSGDKCADLIGTTRWAYGKLLAGNLLADLSKVETLDLSKDYFSQTVRELLTFDGRTFAFSADFDAHLYTQAIMYYNARIWEELGLPDPYQLVRDGEWTWEKCLEYANMALRDYDGNGIVDSESDRWGMVAGNGDLINSMYASMDGKFYDKNQYGALKLDCLDAESAEKLAFIYKFYQQENVLYKRENEGVLDMFSQGKSLFMSRINTNAEQLKNMEDDFGILPMPKWNTEQEDYLCHVNHNTKIYSMTNTNENTYEAGIIISALARRYQSYTDMGLEEFEDVLYRFDEDSEMLRDYIVGHEKDELLDIIRGANTTFLKPYIVMTDSCMYNKFSDINSELLAIENTVNITLDEFLNNLE